MLKNHSQVWNSIHEGPENLLNEDPLPVKEVNSRVSHLSMNEKGEACLPSAVCELMYKHTHWRLNLVKSLTLTVHVAMQRLNEAHAQPLVWH